MTKSWNGKRVLIVGAARQGLALARYLAGNGAVVTLNDQHTADQMETARQALANLPVRWALGGHPTNLLNDADLVCLSGGVPLTLPLVMEAQRRGIPISNDSQIFMEAVPCKVIGITGSAGKTTTTILVGRIAQNALQPPRRAWVGGNVGVPLIDVVDQINADDLAVLELSSFQLEQMTISPQVSAILNITPNHLDRHGTIEAYTAAKANILAYQKVDDFAILGRDDPGAFSLAGRVTGKLLTFGLEQPAPSQSGTYLGDDLLYLSDGNKIHKIMPRSLIQLRGDHNLLNVLAACAISYAAGLSIDAMIEGVTNFTGVAHRLEFVRQWKGASWYNDSIATAPERTEAAIRSFNEPLVLLLGGRDKDLPWEKLASLVHQRVDHVIVFGEAREKIVRAISPISNGNRPHTLVKVNGLHEAVQAASEIVQPGDIVLLSPGGTSFDEFKDFEERGERYRQWVHQL
jgi:UDP-N-acetylmuramoylalanine--D-glutamate ligase